MLAGRFFAMQKHSKNKKCHFLAPVGQPEMMHKKEKEYL